MNEIFLKNKYMNSFFISILFIITFLSAFFITGPYYRNYTIDKIYSRIEKSDIYFNHLISQLKDTVNPISLIWHPDHDNSVLENRLILNKKEINSFYIGDYKISIENPENYRDLNHDSLNTYLFITKDTKTLHSYYYKDFFVSQIYKIKYLNIDYILIGFSARGVRENGFILPMVYSDNKLIIGKEQKNFSMHRNIPEDNFWGFNKNLYVTLDDTRYFGTYGNISNNASISSFIPVIFLINKETGNMIFSSHEFSDVYSKLKDTLSIEFNYLSKNILSGKLKIEDYDLADTLIPSFDYYLGISLLSTKNEYSETRKNVLDLYSNIFKNKEILMNPDGYVDFEK